MFYILSHLDPSDIRRIQPTNGKLDWLCQNILYNPDIIFSNLFDTIALSFFSWGTFSRQLYNGWFTKYLETNTLSDPATPSAAQINFRVLRTSTKQSTAFASKIADFISSTGREAIPQEELLLTLYLINIARGKYQKHVRDAHQHRCSTGPFWLAATLAHTLDSTVLRQLLTDNVFAGQEELSQWLGIMAADPRKMLLFKTLYPLTHQEEYRKQTKTLHALTTNEAIIEALLYLVCAERLARQLEKNVLSDLVISLKPVFVQAAMPQELAGRLTIANDLFRKALLTLKATLRRSVETKSIETRCHLFPINVNSFRRINLHDQNLRQLYFYHQDLSFSNLGSSDISSSRFEHCKLKGTYCSGANLIQVKFRDSDLDNTNFSNARLEHTLFENCKLRSVDFTNTDLRYTTFTNSSISLIKLFNARILGVTGLERTCYPHKFYCDCDTLINLIRDTASILDEINHQPILESVCKLITLLFKRLGEEQRIKFALYFKNSEEIWFRRHQEGGKRGTLTSAYKKVWLTIIRKLRLLPSDYSPTKQLDVIEYEKFRVEVIMLNLVSFYPTPNLTLIEYTKWICMNLYIDFYRQTYRLARHNCHFMRPRTSEEKIKRTMSTGLEHLTSLGENEDFCALIRTAKKHPADSARYITLSRFFSNPNIEKIISYQLAPGECFNGRNLADLDPKRLTIREAYHYRGSWLKQGHPLPPAEAIAADLVSHIPEYLLNPQG